MTLRKSLIAAAGLVIATAGISLAQSSSATAAFDTRAEKHRGGVFFTLSDIQKRSPARLSDLFRNMSGVTLTTSDGGKVVITSTRGARTGLTGGASGIAGGAMGATSPSEVNATPTVTGSRCTVLVGMDGQVMDAGFSVDDVPVTSVHGIEVYTGSAHVPVEFGAGNNTGCGVIMIWSKTGADKNP